jgi:hypothetical protein
VALLRSVVLKAALHLTIPVALVLMVSMVVLHRTIPEILLRSVVLTEAHHHTILVVLAKVFLPTKCLEQFLELMKVPKRLSL